MTQSVTQDSLHSSEGSSATSPRLGERLSRSMGGVVADLRARSHQRITLAEGLNGRNNALGIIRLILAAAVIVAHAYPLTGRGIDPLFRWSLSQENLGGYAVVGFFAISGYLITKSGMRGDILQYMWARILRIFPAFIVVLGFGAFVVGPLVWLSTGRPIGEYFALGEQGPFTYITANASLAVHQWGIGDLFQSTTPWGQTVGYSVFNGSLWTLAYEWSCYLLIAVMVLFGVLTRFRMIVPMLTIVLFGLQIARLAGVGVGAVVPWLGDSSTINLTLIFMCGACLALYADRILLDDRLGLLCLAVVIWTVFNGGFGTVGFPAFAYVLLWLAARLPDWLKRVGSKNDYSFGIYLYGFLVQQTLVHFGGATWHFVPFVVASLVISAALAWLSWHCVEKPALSFKGRGPGRGIRYWTERLSMARTVKA